jgi:hypothetical protein
MIMNCRTPLIAVALAATAITLAAQETKTTQQTTQQNPDGSVQTTTKTTTITGSVVRYTPGQTIVIQSTDGKTTTYAIGASVEVPAEVQVGKKVTISTEPSSDGSGPALVTHVETTSVNSQGQTKTTTERTETNASGQTKTTTTTVYGTVTAFEPGQSISIERPGQQTVTYTIDSASQLPQDLAVGKSVTIQTTTVSGSPVVRRITYRTTTKTKTSTQ